MEVIFIILLILILLAGLYLLLLMPARGDKAAKMRTKLYAHRGYHHASLHIPENSLAAFRRAVAFGYGVEFDIQLTKDKRVVVFHDENLKRMCGVDRRLADCTYDQLSKLTLSGTKEQIPLLEEVLETVGKNVPILCEVKIYGSVTDTSVLEVALPLLRQYADHLVVESFNPFALFWLRTNAPEIPRGQLSCHFSHNKPGDPNPVVGFILQHLLCNLFTAPHFIAYRHADSKCVSFRLMKKLYRPLTVAWTVHSDKEQRIALSRVGFDATIFEGYQATPLPVATEQKRAR